MKPKTHNGNGNSSDNNNNSGGGSSSSPSPPPSPPLRSNVSQCRRRVRSKAQSQLLKDSFGGGILFRRNLRYLVVLPLLYLSGLLMCVGGPFSALVGWPTTPGAVYRSHDMFRKLWPHIHSDNSSVLEVRCLFWVFHLVAEENAGKEKRKQLFQFVLFLFFLCKIWFLIATFEVRKGMFLIMEYTRFFFFFLSIRITSF